MNKQYSIEELKSLELKYSYVDTALTFTSWLERHEKHEPLSSLSQETECKVHDAKGGDCCVYCGYRPKLASPHLDRKIEPLKGFDGGGIIFQGEHLRWIQEKSGHEFVKKINELVERFNQLQEERR